MENKVCVLLAEQEREILSLLTLLLSDIKECELEICSQTSEVLKRFGVSKPGLVLLNAGIEPEPVLSILQEIHQNNSGIYVIVSLHEKSLEAVNSLMAAGAHDCVLKDRNYVPNIVSAVKKALIRIAEREAFDVPVLARAQRFAMDENLPDIVFSLGLDGKILYVNQAISSLLEYEQKEVVGTNFSNLLTAETDQITFKRYLDDIGQEINFRETAMLKNRSGQDRPYDINFTLMEGEIIYGVVRNPGVSSRELEESADAAESDPAEAESDASPTEAIPARLGPYRIVTLLGGGSMGRVYKGFDEQLERDVAIKVISKSLAENQKYVERFKREAKILASISHPNIALIYYFGSLDTLPYFCMEYLANGSLEKLLETEEVIDPQMAISYVIQLATGYASLLALRFLVGFGLGGELPVASTLVTEFSPAEHRGRLLVILESFWAFGWAAAAIISFLIIPRFEQGWKIAFAIGFLPAFYSFYLRRSIPESPRYLETVGRHEEAKAAVQWLETESGVPHAEIIPERRTPATKIRLTQLWQGKFVRRTLMLWVLWFAMVYSYYGIFTWLPSLLVSEGNELVKSFEYVLIITLAQIPGYFCAAYLVDKIGRKATLVPFLVGCAIAAYIFGRATTGFEIIFYGCLISFFNLGAWGVVYTYTPELYPTDMRATGAGTAIGVGRIGGIVAPLVVAKILAANLGQQAIFAQFAAVVIAGAVVVALFGEETKKKSLEEI